MTETLPRSFTVSTVVHALLVAAGLLLASRVPANSASRALTIPEVVLEIPLEVERPRPVPPPPAAAPPPPPREAPRIAHAPRVAAPTALTPPTPSAPPTAAPVAPAAPAPVLTAQGGDPSMAASSTGTAAPTPVITPTRVAEATSTATPAPSSAPQGPSFDPGSYLSGVTDRVRRHRNYPAIAQEMGLEGIVEVRVVVAPDGTLAAPPSIDESCGHEVLDDEALRIVRRAAPFPPLVGRNQRVTLRVPVHFHLDT